MTGSVFLFALGVMAAGPAPARVPFVANDGVHGWELWVTDGTAGGTSLLKDIRPGKQGSSIVGKPLLFEGKYYFAADDGSHGEELWRTDLTPAGTVLVKDINPGPKSSDPQWLAVWGRSL